jgi:glucose/mannose-6-phosphate isomerase
MQKRYLMQTTDQTYREIDKSDMYTVLEDFPNQIIKAYALGEIISVKPFNKIVFSGMGGSAIGGLLLQSYLDKTGFSLPFQVVRDYDIPAYVDKDTLFIACSYSGNTEETLACYTKAKKKNAQIVALASGGKLQEMAQSDQKCFVLLPTGMQPRNAVAYAFFSILKMLERHAAIKKMHNIEKLVKTLKERRIHAVAQHLAKKTYGKTPVIYGSPCLNIVAYRWKTQFNENAKTPSYWHEFPELNHNELNGFYNIEGKFHIIILKTSFEHKRVNKRIQLTKKIIEERLPVTEIHLEKNDLLTQIFRALFIGDLASYYLSLLYKTDPTPVPVIESFKKDMGPYKE